jgi:hypothetical protein
MAHFSNGDQSFTEVPYPHTTEVRLSLPPTALTSVGELLH